MLKDFAYDLFMLVGAGLVTSGVAVDFGVGAALMAGGLLVMLLTLAGARR